jgi:hypothetical protein
MHEQEIERRRKERICEINAELERLDRGIFPDRTLGRWGVSTERVARLRQSLYRELDLLLEADRRSFERYLNSRESRAANLREIGLGLDGKPINDASCRAPGSLARWPSGHRGTEWASAVGSRRYSDRGFDCKI